MDKRLPFINFFTKICQFLKKVRKGMLLSHIFWTPCTEWTVFYHCLMKIWTFPEGFVKIYFKLNSQKGFKVSLEITKIFGRYASSCFLPIHMITERNYCKAIINLKYLFKHYENKIKSKSFQLWMLLHFRINWNT